MYLSLVMNPIAYVTQRVKARATKLALKNSKFVLVTVNGFDTDALGACTSKIMRWGIQLDAVIVKARKPCEMSGERCRL